MTSLKYLKDLQGLDILAFDVDNFISKTTKPFLNELITETEAAFDIAEHLIALTVFDPLSTPTENNKLPKFGEKEITDLCNFHGMSSSVPSLNDFGPLFNPTVLIEQFKAFKLYLFKRCPKWEKKQTNELADAQYCLQSLQSQKKSLGTLISKRKVGKYDQRIKMLENEINKLAK